jgi:hypothetical protein
MLAKNKEEKEKRLIEIELIKIIPACGTKYLNDSIILELFAC